MEIEMKVQFYHTDLGKIMSVIQNPNYTVDEFVKKSDSFFTDKTDSETRKAASSVGGKVVRIRCNGKLPKNAFQTILSQTRVFPSVGKETYFTTKIKTVNGSYENNVEHELKIDDADTMAKCLEDMGYRCWFNKCKYSYGMYTKRNNKVYHVEIERVMNEANGKNVLFVEIENTESTNNNNPEAIIADERLIFEELGLNPNGSDNRPWVKILS